MEQIAQPMLKMKRLLSFFIFGIFLISCVSAAIIYTSPYPVNDTLSSSALITANISMDNLTNVSINWNGTTYMIYNDSIIFKYNLDNNSLIGDNATFLRDISKSNYSGASLQNSTPYTSGVVGQAIFLNRTLDQYIEFGSISTLAQSGTNKTYCAWFYPYDYPNVSENIFEFSSDTQVNPDTTGLRTYIRYTDYGGLLFSVNNYVAPTMYYSTVSYRNRTEINRWYRVCGSVDYRAYGQVKLYLNGQLVASGSRASSAGASNDNYMRIGRRGNWNNNIESSNFLGLIDEIVIYNSTMDANMALWDYQAYLKKIQTLHGL